LEALKEMNNEENLEKLVQDFVKKTNSPSERINAKLLLAIYVELRRHPIKKLLGIK